MVELDKVAELLRNRYLANVPNCGYTSRLRWRLGTAGPTENVSPGDSQTGEKKYIVFFNAEIKCAFFFRFISFYYFFYFLFFISFCEY